MSWDLLKDSKGQEYWGTDSDQIVCLTGITANRLKGVLVPYVDNIEFDMEGFPIDRPEIGRLQCLIVRIKN